MFSTHNVQHYSLKILDKAQKSISQNEPYSTAHLLLHLTLVYQNSEYVGTVTYPWD